MKKLLWKMKQVMEGLKEDQQGIGVIEVVLILVVLIGLVLIFKNEISAIVSSAFDSIKLNSEAIVK